MAKIMIIKDQALKSYLKLALPGALLIYLISFCIENFTKLKVGSIWILGFTFIQIISVVMPVITRLDKNKFDVIKVFVASLVVRIVLLPIFLIFPVVFKSVELILFMISLAIAYTVMQILEIRWLFIQIGKQGENNNSNNSTSL